MKLKIMLGDGYKMPSIHTSTAHISAYFVSLVLSLSAKGNEQLSKFKLSNKI